MATQCLEFVTEDLEAWLTRKVRSGALLELPTYHDRSGGLGRRPDKVARRLLDDLRATSTDRNRGSDHRAVRQAAWEFRTWVLAQPGPARMTRISVDSRGESEVRSGASRSPGLRLALRRISEPAPVEAEEQAPISFASWAAEENRRNRGHISGVLLLVVVLVPFVYGLVFSLVNPGRPVRDIEGIVVLGGLLLVFGNMVLVYRRAWLDQKGPHSLHAAARGKRWESLV